MPRGTFPEDYEPDYEGEPAHQYRGRGHDQSRTRLEGPYVGFGPKGYVRPDARIYEDVCERLARFGHLDASDIEVRVVDGEVTLTGTVPDRDQKRLAEDLADGVTGVKDVHNLLRLRVRYQAASTGPDRMGDTSEDTRTPGSAFPGAKP
jgi:osmotically-inducible protein OsmY